MMVRATPPAPVITGDAVTPPDVPKIPGNAAFRQRFRPFLMSDDMVELTMKRCQEDADYHLQILRMNFASPVAVRTDDAQPVRLNVLIGGVGANELNLQYSPKAPAALPDEPTNERPTKEP